jgi:hypothetical protein
MEVSMRYLGLIFGLFFLFSCGQNRTKQSENSSFDSMMMKPDYSSTTNLTGEERKRRTNEFLKELSIGQQNVCAIVGLGLIVFSFIFQITFGVVGQFGNLKPTTSHT